MRDLRNLKEIKVGGVNISNIRYADDRAVFTDSQDELQALISALDQSGRERERTVHE